MTPLAPADQARPTLGIALMALAMLSIPLVDGIAKYLSADHSPLFIAWARYAVALAAVVLKECVLECPVRRWSHCGIRFCRRA